MVFTPLFFHSFSSLATSPSSVVQTGVLEGWWWRWWWVGEE